VQELESGDEDDLPVVSDEENMEDGDASSATKLRVKIDGTNPPEPASTFSALNLQDWLMKNVANMGWKKPTLVQSASLPAVLDHRDVIVASPTGSGKTGSYLIPLLNLLEPIIPEYENQPTEDAPKDDKSKKQKSKKGKTEEKKAAPITESSCRSLIIAPTRELCQQVYTQLRKLAAGQNLKFLLLTKAAVKKTADGEKQPTSDPITSNPGPWDVVISTPSRLTHVLNRSKISLAHVQSVILDEVDRLLGGDFIEQVDNVLTKCKEAAQRRPADQQRLKIGMFTATFTPAVEQLAKSGLSNAIRVVIGTKNTAVSNVQQFFKFSGTEEGKLMTMRNMLGAGEIRPPCLVFLQSKERAMELFQQLVGENVPVDLVTGDRSEAQRDKAIHGFRTGTIWILITTDLLARGMDFPAVHTVINYDLPSTPSQYIHRVGRAGRAQQHGRTKQIASAQTLITERDVPYLKPFINVVVASGFAKNVPEWLLNLDKIDQQHRRAVQQGRVIKRDSIDPIRAAQERKIEQRKRKYEQRNETGKPEESSAKRRKME
jgi:ATP-dependent RNA helicase DDX52/ROK1